MVKILLPTKGLEAGKFQWNSNYSAGTPDTDWQDEFTDAAIRHEHNGRV